MPASFDPPELLPPEPLPPEDCLVHCYPSTQKGGTIIVETVTDLDMHFRRLCFADGYRPSHCPTCGHEVMYVHDYPERVLRADPDRRVITIVRHRCAAPDCRAVWRILPRFLARHLWRRWAVVETNTVGGPKPPNQPEVPGRTQRRWWQRLGAAASQLLRILMTDTNEALAGIALALSLNATREDLVRVHAAKTGSVCGRWLADVAALIHRLAPGVRLM